MNYLLPRERLLEQGASALTDAELIAVLLRTGWRNHGQKSSLPSVIELSDDLLKKAGGLAGIFALRLHELSAVKGMGKTKAATLLAVREITERLFRRNSMGCPAITGLQDAYQLFLDLILEEQEVLSAAFLDPRNRLLHRENIFRGSLTFALASPREILRIALRVNAASIIVAHNHPSQDPTPSPDDRLFTDQLREACKLVGIHFLDHLVICSGNNYVSMSVEESACQGYSGFPAENAIADSE